ncbi:MAG: hypothetical protein NWE77_07210 [Candidatus Bathyarchaeota archaeon]|nr:hypothetical protein [Candidatus Bathyarchaeota archaeon]
MPRFLAKHLIFILPVLAVLSFALFIAYLSASVEAPRVSIVPFSLEGGVTAVLVNVSFIASVISLSLPFIYLTLKKGWTSLIEKMFAICGGGLTLLLSGILAIHLLELFPSFLLLISIWLFSFFICVSIVFAVAGVFSEEMRNLVFMMYSSVVGSLLGMGIPMFSMLFILIYLCAIDLLSFKLGLLRRIVTLSEDRVFFRLKYSDRELVVGLGDLIFYSMLGSYSLVNFGASIAVLSTFLILVGWIVTFIYTTKSEVFPGLPIPLGLGMIPIVVEITSSMM